MNHLNEKLLGMIASVLLIIKLALDIGRNLFLKRESERKTSQETKEK